MAFQSKGGMATDGAFRCRRVDSCIRNVALLCATALSRKLQDSVNVVIV